MTDFSKTETFTPTEFVGVVNQTLEYAYSSVLVTGEVASFKVNQGKWVFFDLKDEETSVSCFMTLWSLRQPLEDGMKVTVRAVPKLTKWGKFSLTVSTVQPVGEGSLKKAYELLKKKLTAEGLFDPAKKRSLPDDLLRVGVISSTQAAGYADFIKIINARWGGMKVQVAHTQVQGMDAPDQIIRALQYFNERADVQVIAILRGGGSADDLSCFNDEKLVREIASSRIPVITGIGHEVDESLSDLAADVRASTPSNAAEILTRDQAEELEKLSRSMNRVNQVLLQQVDQARFENREKVQKVSRGLLTKYIEPSLEANKNKMTQMLQKIQGKVTEMQQNVQSKLKLLEALNPEQVLAQGYAILSGKISPGMLIKITTFSSDIEAEVKKVMERNKN
ncbi:exodeoxyribonuclease VII large subunit [Candidatus Saccharibacteria bacterium]|nr:exodeoxyribonuclease VII large subunit [Candidatus Saccharibacteria bacterium]